MPRNMGPLPDKLRMLNPRAESLCLVIEHNNGVDRYNPRHVPAVILDVEYNPDWHILAIFNNAYDPDWPVAMWDSNGPIDCD